jgi:hypothetical protein
VRKSPDPANDSWASVTSAPARSLHKPVYFIKKSYADFVPEVPSISPGFTLLWTKTAKLG